MLNYAWGLDWRSGRTVWVYRVGCRFRLPVGFAAWVYGLGSGFRLGLRFGLSAAVTCMYSERERESLTDSFWTLQAGTGKYPDFWALVIKKCTPNEVIN